MFRIIWTNYFSNSFYLLAAIGCSACFSWILGSFLLGIYLMWKKRFPEGDGALRYLVLRIILITFLLPVGVVLLLIQEAIALGVEGMFFKVHYWMPEPFQIGFGVLMLVYIAVAAVRVVHELLGFRAYKTFIRMEQIEDYQATAVLQETLKLLGCRRKGKAYWSSYVESPYTMGILHPKVMYPNPGMNEEQIRIVSFHEAYHIKRFDVVWKQLLVLVGKIYFFLPFFQHFCDEFHFYCEASCDQYICRQKAFPLEANDYYKVILSLSAIGNK